MRTIFQQPITLEGLTFQQSMALAKVACGKGAARAEVGYGMLLDENKQPVATINPDSDEAVVVKVSPESGARIYKLLCTTSRIHDPLFSIADQTVVEAMIKQFMQRALAP
ncbi:hypothetical protein [Burkholderia ubonensis]|uniref:Uncharacterized protein n=1 Tax=Burkholderia ubonensis subsp. mesacidophila TaxID=265293 RepID=A0A2A4FDL4_9BURK|nr:hypothetical protein [Burkholderia ubonensis]PCE30698.1 hypothetical protein BZL54_19540 [Burkholderia ubonensis subsp. mesacidophila]